MKKQIDIHLNNKEDYKNKYNENILSYELSNYILEETKGISTNKKIEFIISSDFEIDNKEKNNIKPDHYGDSGIDVISFCQANNLDFMQGNVIKYITRYRKKNGLEDLRKAVEYINRILAAEYPEFEAVVKTIGIEIY